MNPILSEEDKQRLREAYEQRWALLRSYNPNIENETRRLEDEGRSIAQMLLAGDLNADRLRAFLRNVTAWKMPHRKDEVTKTAELNSDATIVSTFGRLHSPAPQPSSDVDCSNVEAIVGLRGFQTRMASAVLRHIWPSYYGVVDWRNWALLSNLEGQYLSVQILEHLADSIAELRRNDSLFTVQRYLTYLAALRAMAKDVLGYETNPAEVDLAIWAMSWEYIPSHYAKAEASKIESRLRDGFQKSHRGRLQLFEHIWQEQNHYIQSLSEPEDRYWAWQDLLVLAQRAIPPNFFKRDAATGLRGPYHKFFARDLHSLYTRLASYPLERRIAEMSKFFFDHMLKGEGLGVIG